MSDLLFKIASFMQKTSIKIISFLFSSLIAYILDYKMLFLALGWAIIFDLITGIWAYSRDKVKRELDKANKEYMLKSKLLKKTLSKTTGYLILILMMAIFETHVFKVQFDFVEKIIGQKMYGTGMITTVCIFIEYYSILENLKKMGLDIIGEALKIFKYGKNIIEKFKK